eukprot:FR741354.1.p1 GENE.FR741354.1~~FR741354.1.p1  ORF type:complete len:258 (+),score=13.70 FR741354.1:105-878(+)
MRGSNHSRKRCWPLSTHGTGLNTTYVKQRFSCAGRSPGYLPGGGVNAWRPIHLLNRSGFVSSCSDAVSQRRETRAKEVNAEAVRQEQTKAAGQRVENSDSGNDFDDAGNGEGVGSNGAPSANDWTKCYDGPQPYYFSASLEKSVWSPPPGYVSEEAESLNNEYATTPWTSSSAAAEMKRRYHASSTPASADSEDSDWEQEIDPESGVPYFYSRKHNLSTWSPQKLSKYYDDGDFRHGLNTGSKTEEEGKQTFRTGRH